MTDDLHQQQVDIRDYPKAFFPLKKNEALTVGDLHGSALKLLFVLAKHQIIHFENGSQDYLTLAAIYLKQQRTLKCYRQGGKRLKAFTATPENGELSKDDLDRFWTILSRANFREVGLIRLIGDELADRGHHDLLTLFILKILTIRQVPVIICISNHSLSAIESFFKILESPLPLSHTFNFLPGQDNSWQALVKSINQKLISKAELKNLFERVYLNKLVLIDSDLTQSNQLYTFSHSFLGLDMLFTLVNFLNRQLGAKINYQETNEAALEDVIDEVNQVIVPKVRNGECLDLFTMNKTPLYAIIWAREIKKFERFHLKNNRTFIHVHGHVGEDGGADKKSLINLDTKLGREQEYGPTGLFQSANYHGSYRYLIYSPCEKKLAFYKENAVKQSLVYLYHDWKIPLPKPCVSFFNYITLKLFSIKDDTDSFLFNQLMQPMMRFLEEKAIDSFLILKMALLATTHEKLPHFSQSLEQHFKQHIDFCQKIKLCESYYDDYTESQMQSILVKLGDFYSKTYDSNKLNFFLVSNGLTVEKSCVWRRWLIDAIEKLIILAREMNIENTDNLLSSINQWQDNTSKNQSLLVSEINDYAEIIKSQNFLISTCSISSENSINRRYASVLSKLEVQLIFTYKHWFFSAINAYWQKIHDKKEKDKTGLEQTYQLKTDFVGLLETLLVKMELLDGAIINRNKYEKKLKALFDDVTKISSLFFDKLITKNKDCWRDRFQYNYFYYLVSQYQELTKAHVKKDFSQAVTFLKILFKQQHQVYWMTNFLCLESNEIYSLFEIKNLCLICLNAIVLSIKNPHANQQRIEHEIIFWNSMGGIVYGNQLDIFRQYSKKRVCHLGKTLSCIPKAHDYLRPQGVNRSGFWQRKPFTKSLIHEDKAHRQKVFF